MPDFDSNYHRYQRDLAAIAGRLVDLSRLASDLHSLLKRGVADPETRSDICTNLPPHELEVFMQELSTNERRAIKLLNATRVVTREVSHLQFVLYCHLPKE